jgi:ribosomal protein S18 acetylase RimI-like enzyme
MTIALRPARSTDAGKVGAILSQYLDETKWMPDLYTGAQTIAYCGVMIDRDWVIVAMEDEKVVGFIARNAEEICALYVVGPAQGRNIGQQLLKDAKTRIDRLTLRVFQANTGAQKFYSREGFKETGRGDGKSNDENLPDLSFAWEKGS